MMTAQTIATIRSARLVKVPSAPGNRVEADNRGCQFGLSCHVFPESSESESPRGDLPSREAPRGGPVRSRTRQGRKPRTRRRTLLLGFEPRSKAPEDPRIVRRFVIQ